MKIDKIIEELEEEKLLIWNDDNWFEIGYNNAIDAAKQLIQYYIVPCKDCVHNKGNEANIQCEIDLNRSKGSMWFCADGERKE